MRKRNFALKLIPLYNAPIQLYFINIFCEQNSPPPQIYNVEFPPCEILSNYILLFNQESLIPFILFHLIKLDIFFLLN